MLFVIQLKNQQTKNIIVRFYQKKDYRINPTTQRYNLLSSMFLCMSFSLKKVTKISRKLTFSPPLRPSQSLKNKHKPEINQMNKSSSCPCRPIILNEYKYHTFIIANDLIRFHPTRKTKCKSLYKYERTFASSLRQSLTNIIVKLKKLQFF